MSGIDNLSREIRRQLPAEMVGFLKTAGETAQGLRQRVYLVGGVVRDLMLGQANFDLDLVVEGDVVKLARELAGTKKAGLVVHSRFGTAKLKFDTWSADLATARAESYARPGALPDVRPGAIEDDLVRRDFTINAMAAGLCPEHFGEVLDLHGGRDDLEQRLIRVLHPRSFIDDATRMWRGIRYEQRLGFLLELKTLELLERDIDMLDTVSGDRVRHELELVLREELPEKVLCRADELGVLTKMHPSLKCNGWLAERMSLARAREHAPGRSLYLALLAYRLNALESGELIAYLRLPRTSARVLRDSIEIKDKIGELSDPGLSPGRIYSLLKGYSLTAVTASALAASPSTTTGHIELYLNSLRYVKPILTGEDLKKLGVPEGPRIGEILDLLLTARLEGRVAGRRGEEEMVQAIEKGKTSRRA